MKILVIRFSSLGDCILLCPFLEHLKRNGAEEISVVTKREYVELFSAAVGVDRVIAIERTSGVRGLKQIIRGHREKDYEVIDAHNTMRSLFVSRGLGGAASRLRKYYRERLELILFKRHSEIPTMASRYGELGDALGFPPMESRTGGIRIPDAVNDRVRSMLPPQNGRAVTIAPGSRWPMKRWETEKFVSVAHHIIQEHGHRVVIVGDESDAALADRIAEGADADTVVNLAGKTSVVETAAAIQNTHGFIGNDSGLMHLAEAVGVPVIALFGPTVEAFGYYPSDPRSKVVERDIDCRPCSRNGKRACPKTTQECLTAIPAEAVERAYADFVEDKGPNRYVVS